MQPLPQLVHFRAITAVLDVQLALAEYHKGLFCFFLFFKKEEGDAISTKWGFPKHAKENDVCGSNARPGRAAV